MKAPCHGQSELFDAVDEHSHREARKLCMGCPLRMACKKLLDDTMLEYRYGGPEGTWAGILVKDRIEVEVVDRELDRARIAHEDAFYSEDDAKRAHAAYRTGDRTPWAITGQHVYDRRLRRAQRAERRTA